MSPTRLTKAARLGTNSPPLTALDWLHVEEACRRSFHGQPFSDADAALCRRAMSVDPVRYREIHPALVIEYKRSLLVR